MGTNLWRLVIVLLIEGSDSVYCYVIFGDSKDNHTRCYLYECKNGLEPGDMVKVPANNISKNALVKEVFERISDEISIDFSKVKSVISRNSEIVDERTIRSYLLALIDEYKDGKISKENLYAVIEHLVSTSELHLTGDAMVYIINHQLPDACLYYIDEPGDTEEKELGFWKELKDIEYKLRYGYSFWKRPVNKFLDIKEDEIEYTDEYLKIELELERLIRAEIGDGGYMGFCHKYWWTKKRILKDRFGIEWKSPVDLNPTVNFD